MSLSKYYKDSSSFKREKIVKDNNTPDQTGWKSRPTKPVTQFEPGGMSTSHNENHISPSTTVEKTAPPPPPADIPKDPVPDDQSIETPVDLSNYITLEEAESKAAEMFQQGVKEGIAKTTEDFGSALKMLTFACQQLDTIRETIIANSSNELTEFTLLIAEKIIRASIKEHDHTIIATIQEALSRAVKSDEFTLFVNPIDYQTVADKSPDLIASVSGLNNIVLKSDPTIEQGGAKIESENCIIDATVTSQFETIRNEIQKSKTE